VLSLPIEVHPLLIDGPEGDKQTWAALRNYNDDIRRYDGLQWTVAHQLARQQSNLSEDRIIGIATKAVEFEVAEDAIEFIESAAEKPHRSQRSSARSATPTIHRGPSYCGANGPNGEAGVDEVLS
jgi:hypothetical protein